MDQINVIKRNGTQQLVDESKYIRQIEFACSKVPGTSTEKLINAVKQTFYDGIKTTDLNKNLERGAQELSSTTEQTQWTFVAAVFVIQELYKEVSGDFTYPHLSSYIEKAVAGSNLQPRVVNLYDIEALNAAIVPERDYKFDYLGISTLRDRYLLRDAKTRKIVEMPQHMIMRVAMGVALAPSLSQPLTEELKASMTAKAIQFYNELSEFGFMSSTPTLFNSGLLHSQLSSCFGIHMTDDFEGIWDALKEAGSYSKYGGGIAMDFTSVRGSGAPIRTTGGEAGGPIPYIKMLNDTLIGFDQQGKRRGSGAPYMETWHVNIEDFLSLREPGDDRLRTHDLFPANWIPDLFMTRMRNDEDWSLFDPIDVPNLHFIWGAEFEAAYLEAEAKGLARKKIPAVQLWELMLTRLAAHGVFWHCYKDRMNERYPLRKLAPVTCSNLCTEIALRSGADSSFVCNLGSINASKDDFLLEKGPDGKFLWNMKLSQSVFLAIEFLNYVIDAGFVPSERGRKMQMEDRPIGLGLMGWTTALYKLGIDYESVEHVEYANEFMKQVSVSAMYASAQLGARLGSFPTFEHSTWAEGIITPDTLVNRTVVEEFNLDLSFDHCPFVDEHGLRAMVKRGMRNSTLLAIAPTATISNICGVEECTQLSFDRVFQKKNLSGTFDMVSRNIDNNRHGLPLKTAYSVDHMWTIRAAAARQVWICQSQSTNIWLDTNLPSWGDKMDQIYDEAHRIGLKTMYYCYGRSEETVPQVGDTVATPVQEHVEPDVVGAVCMFRPGDAGFDTCEACQ